MDQNPSAIVVEGLSKRYRLGQLEPYKTLRDTLVSGVSQVAGKFLRSVQGRSGQSAIALKSSADRELWALKDLSFEVPEGGVVGIVGRNGAGKSTLLKLISRITEPTSGQITLRGRVGSLLEVGTGFHPELTGKENVYLNGIILGMRKGEIDRKFDEIVDFAGVERFLETPVKRYSSGMKLRLGFAVAAHLEPDILIVDEVLAVGDAEFQKKCLARMGDVAREGRTVLFVSHNLGAVQRLCDRAILLEGGEMKFYGETAECLSEYEKTVRDAASKDLTIRKDRSGTGEIVFTSLNVKDLGTGDMGYVQSGSTAEITVTGQVVNRAGVDAPVIVRVSIFDQMQQVISHLSTLVTDENFHLDGNEFKATCRINKMALNAGSYSMSASIGTEHSIFDYLTDICTFEMVHGSFYESGRLPEAGLFPALLDYNWKSDSSD